MLKFFLVFIGGGLGASARYFLTTILAGKLGNFPLGTLVINIIGCFIMGIMTEIFTEKVDAELYRVFITVGFLGGFTTLSAFYAESFALIHAGQFFSFAVSAFGNLLIAFFACLAGIKLAQLLF